MIIGTRSQRGNLIVDCQCEGCGEEYEAVGGSLYDAENRYCPLCNDATREASPRENAR